MYAGSAESYPEAIYWIHKENSSRIINYRSGYIGSLGRKEIV